MNEGFYDQPHESQVGRLARGAASWALLLMLARQIVTIVTTMIVSRFLTPAEFGTVGMVSTFIAFIVLFDTALTWATVQTKELSKEQFDSLFWFGLLLGSLLWLICWQAGPYLAVFYDNADLPAICTVMGLVPLINSLTTQPAALLKRKMQQNVTNSVDTSAILISCIIAVVFAMTDCGYWAIIAQSLAVQLVRMPLLIYYSGFRPSFPRLSAQSIPLIKVGIGLALSNFVCYFQLYLGGILVGHAFGTVALGNYLKAYGVKSLPTSYAAMVVTDVMISALAAMRGNPEKMGAAYRKALTVTSYVGCPAGAILFPAAPEIIRLLYGTQWDAVIPLLRWFSLPAVLLPITTTTIWLFISSGKVRQQLWMNMLLTAFTVLFFFGAWKIAHDTEDIVIAEALMISFLFPIVNVIFSHRAANIAIIPTLQAVWPIILFSIISAAVSLLVGELLATMSWQALLIAKLSTGAVTYLWLSLKFVKPFPIPSVEKFAEKRIF